MSEYRAMRTREAQFAAIQLARDCDFPPMAFGTRTIEPGRESWLQTVHRHPAWAANLCERLSEIQRFNASQGARVELTIIDPALGATRRPPR